MIVPKLLLRSRLTGDNYYVYDENPWSNRPRKRKIAFYLSDSIQLFLHF